MEPDEFLYDGVVIPVALLSHVTSTTDDYVWLGLDSGLGEGRFILYLDGEPFLIEDAGEQGSVRDINFYDHGISWSNNEEVEVRLSVNRPATGAPAITGKPEVGETLTADISAIEDPDGRPADADLDYQWVRSDGVTDEDIDGADRLHLRAGGRRRRPGRQGAGQLHRRRQLLGIADQRPGRPGCCTLG